MPEQDPYDDDENEIIGMEKYISFIADTKGWLYESLSDSINNEFNEYGAMEEPTISKSLTAGNNNKTLILKTVCLNYWTTFHTII
jgi:hypothetical protein